MESTTAARRAIDAATFSEAFRITAANRANECAVRTMDDEVAWTWGQLQQRSDAVAGGLVKLGLERGQCIAIMLANRPEFHLVDIAAITVGATPFSIYQTYAPNQIQYVVSDAEGRAAHAPQPHDRGQVGRGDHPLPRGLARDLVAPGGAHRRALRAPLPADRLRLRGHRLPGPAQGHGVRAGGAPALVLRGAAH